MRALAENALQKDPGASLVLLLRADGATHVAGAGAEIHSRAPDGDTLFEIGSITKVFTATLLASAEQRGEVATDATLGSIWPQALGDCDAGSIRLRDLARHKSGLPRLPSNFKPRNSADPYADYDVPMATAALLAWKRPASPKFDYSNFGAGILGAALAHVASKDYATLMTERIAEPLGMRSTSVDIPETSRARLAQPRVAKRPFRTWSFQCLAGAGALKSTANDLLRFLGAQESGAAPELARAFASLRSSWTPADGQLRIGSGWLASEVAGHDRPLVWHNGGTGGSSSFCGFIPGCGIAVVVLVNCATGVVDVDALGSALVKLALAPPTR